MFSMKMQRCREVRRTLEEKIEVVVERQEHGVNEKQNERVCVCLCKRTERIIFWLSIIL